MLIVDQQTGQGISHVRLISDNGIVYYTRADGSVLWTESALMDREVSFRIETSTAQRMVTVRVIPGGTQKSLSRDSQTRSDYPTRRATRVENDSPWSQGRTFSTAGNDLEFGVTA
jgi:hypothetical protein